MIRIVDDVRLENWTNVGIIIAVVSLFLWTVMLV